MRSVLVMALSDLAVDPRVNRQIRFLHGHYDLVTLGYRPAGIPDVEFLGISPLVGAKNPLVRKAKGALRRAHAALRFLGRDFESYYWSQGYVREMMHAVADQRADIIIANDVLTLPVACRCAKAWKAKVLFDAHEYAPRELEDLWQWRWFQAPLIRHICREYIPQVDAMTTVCQGIADEYWQTTGVKATVLTNAAEYNDLPVRLHVPGAAVRMIHHGGANRSRKLENMIDMMDHLDSRFELTFVLVGEDRAYHRRLELLAKRNDRVKFLPPVGMRELPRFLNPFDIGLFLLEPTNFNYLHALPNKLFEFIQARLAVAIGASPEMAAVVKRTQVGVVGEDFQPKTLAAHLNRLTSDDINHYKQRSDAVAWELSAEANREILLDICRRLGPAKAISSEPSAFSHAKSRSA
jgi:Glycosyltransferase Family 4/Glycosyl transferases group 1